MSSDKFDICVIGVSNVDIHVKSKSILKEDTSILGEVVLTQGGVGRNIAYGMAALKIYVSFISIFSSDAFSDFLLKDLDSQYISMEKSIFNACSTSKYVDLSVENKNYGINDIKNIIEFSIPFFQKKIAFLNNMRYVIIDLNMDEETIKYLAKNLKTRLICEATSSLKCKKIFSVLHNIYILKANFIEACAIAKCECDVSYSKLLDSIIYKGVKKTYITLGREGALYADDNLKLHVKPKMIVETNDTVGAGDVFAVGIMYGEKEGWTCEEILIFSINLSFCYLASGGYKLNEKILVQALDMKEHNVEVFYWDEVNGKWKEKVK